MIVTPSIAVPANTDVVLRGRLTVEKDYAEAVAQQADLAGTITGVVECAGALVGDSLTYQTSDVVFDTPKPWGVDAAGYNLRLPLGRAYLPDPDKTYVARIVVFTAGGGRRAECDWKIETTNPLGY